MPSFRFDELLLLSRSERAAKKVKFHPRATIIRGPNDTGKSSLIKSVLFTFGATPAEIDDRWKRAGVSSVVRFRIDDNSYALYRHGDCFSLFSGRGTLLGNFNSITTELAPRIAEIFHFGLTLEAQDGKTITATPAFLLLPFYIDQDGGWSNNWHSFERLQQFKNWRQDCVYYHTGIRPNEW